MMEIRADLELQGHCNHCSHYESSRASVLAPHVSINHYINQGNDLPNSSFSCHRSIEYIAAKFLLHYAFPKGASVLEAAWEFPEVL